MLLMCAPYAAAQPGGSARLIGVRLGGGGMVRGRRETESTVSRRPRQM
ncbi:MAG TPA: hypothetical protein GXZ60_13535 [Intrasporangiaceae bacterium]|nr:hypothetical protein [Intrasporangiaceae bacterium]